MGRALEHLGFSVCGAVGLKEPNIPKNIREIALRHIPRFDAFQDNPWPLLYEDLDTKWPGSRFILTRRNTDSWITSIVRHFGATPHAMQDWIYGVPYPSGNEHIFVKRYHRHNEDVLAYFAHRPNDLLILDIESEKLWEPLATFLNKETPTIPFPHANKGGAGWKMARWLKRKVKRLKNRFTGIVQSTS